MPSETCPVCPKSFERDTAEGARNSAIAHAASKNDEDHKGIGYQKASQMLDISDITVSETSEQVATDGGPQADGGPRDPPAPDVQDDDDQDDVEDVDDLPDRYVPVDEYVETLRANADHVNVDKLARKLSKFDVVDVEATGSRNVEAFTIEEVA